MAKVQLYEGGNIQNQGVTDARFRAADFGPSPLAEGLKKLGEAASKTVEKIDQIQDIQAKTEADRLTVEHTKLVQGLTDRVRQSLGENASAAAEQAQVDLEKGTSDIISHASPRAQRILQSELAVRNLSNIDNWHTHAFDQHKVAYQANTEAANKNDLDAAISEPDEAKGALYLDSIRQRNEQYASFFGLDKTSVENANRGVQSSYFKKRSLNRAASGDPIGAITYANEHHGDMTEDDYADVIRTYRPEALKQSATMRVLGQPDPSGNLFAPQPVESKRGPVTPGDEPNEPPARTADPMAVWANVIHPNEGSARVMDVNGHWAQYGVNGIAHPEVDSGPISQSRAQQIFVDKYWKPSGADKLPAALAALHADTYYLSPKKAPKLLRQSGGDYETYMQLRKDWMAEMAARNPAKFGGNVARSYERRNQNIDAFAGIVGGKHYSFEGRIAAHTSMENVEKEVMADPTVPMDYKMAVIDAARSRRQDLKAEQTNREDRAHELAVTQATQLGEGFTSISQLNPAVASSLSADDYSTLNKLAKNNKNAADKQTLDPYVTDVMVTDPKRFADPKFVNELIKKGAGSDYIADVRTKQAQVRGELLKKVTDAKPDPLSTGELWTIAQPVAQHLGLQFEGDKDFKGHKLSPEQKQQMAERRFKFTTYLHQRATEWAAANPGKKPPEEEIRRWVAGGALQVSGPNSVRLFEADDFQIYQRVPAQDRQSIIRSWSRMTGRKPSPREAINVVADAMRRTGAFQGPGL